MQTSLCRAAAVAAAFILAAFSGDTLGATVIISPVSGTTSGFASTIFPVSNTIDQSGLSAGFTSTVTGFDTYMATNPTHSTSDIGSKFFFGGSPPFGVVDYDLGALYTIDKLALWGASFSAGIKDFDLISSVNSDFSGSTTLGSFSAAQVNSAQQFSFAATTARYVRIDVIDNNGGGTDTAIGEVALSGTASVPEPSIFAFLGLGIAGLCFRRHRG